MTQPKGEPNIGIAEAKPLIQDKVLNMLIEPLAAASVLLNASPTVIDSSAPVRVPKLNGKFSPEWVGENEKIPEETNSFGEMTLMPTDLKSIKTIVRVSNELIRMATGGVTQQLQARIVEDVRDKLDTALLNGDGTDNTVLGLANVAGALTSPFDVSDTDSVIDAKAVMAAKELKPTVIYMNGQDFYKLRKVKDTTGRSLIQPDVTQDATYRLDGTPVRISSKVEEGKPMLVDMGKVIVVRDLAPEVTILTERYAEYDQVGIRVRARYDIGVTHPEAVLVMGA